MLRVIFPGGDGTRKQRKKLMMFARTREKITAPVRDTARTAIAALLIAVLALIIAVMR